MSCRWWRNRHISPELSAEDVNREFKASPPARACTALQETRSSWLIMLPLLLLQTSLPAAPKRPVDAYHRNTAPDPHVSADGPAALLYSRAELPRLRALSAEGPRVPLHRRLGRSLRAYQFCGLWSAACTAWLCVPWHLFSLCF